MGSFRSYGCARCGFAVRIGGPEEFYRAPAGELRAYGHPEPASKEALHRGVDGFWMTLWCPACTAARRVVTLDLEEPCEPLDAWAGRGRPRPGFPFDATSCDACGAELLDEIPGLAPACPGCREGRLEVARASD